MADLESESAMPGKKARRSWRRLFKLNIPDVPEERRASPESEAGVLSKLTFSWMGPLMATGYRRPLKLEDIPLLNPSRSVQAHSAAFDTNFAAAIASEDVKNDLFNALHKTFGREFWIGGLYRLLADLFSVASPYTLRYLIQFALDSYSGRILGGDDDPPPLGRGIGLIVGIILMQILLSLFQNHFLYRGQMVGGQVRVLLTAKILEKSLKISERAKAGGSAAPAGEDAGTMLENVEQTDSPSRQEKEKEIKGDPEKVTDEKSSSSSSDTSHQKGETTKPQSDEGWSNGRVINLVSMDASRVELSISMIHVVWTAPIIILICMALLIVNLSYSALAGLGCLIVATFILIFSVKALYVTRQTMHTVTDARVTLTQEVLQAIRLVKYFSWEESFIERLAGIRNEETRKLQGHLAILNVITALGQSLPVLSAMVSFVTFALGSGRELNAAVIFSSVALFSSLLIPTAYLPGCLGQAADAWASLQKIQEYLLAEEVQDLEVDREMEDGLKIEDAEFTWEKSHASTDKSMDPANKTTDTEDPEIRRKQSELTLGASTLVHDDSPFRLTSLSLSIRRGELIAIIGGIGCGKTSLLSALAGDMRKVHGTLKFSSERAFCPQTAWIQNTTVRENILFGMPFDQEWYNIVVSACQLRRDLEILPNGDSTEIGERGINLSGGQKQRVSLARAIYSKADMLLLDDPLSAVDPYVGKAIFDEAILGVLNGKTRILATHQAHVLSRCDRILWLEEGRIKALGTFETLREEYSEFVDLVKEAEGHQDEVSSKEEEGGGTAKSKEMAAALEKLAGDDTLPALMQVEDQGVDGIPLAVYTSYIASSRRKGIVILVIPLLLLASGGNILSGLWLAWWSGDKYGLTRNTYVGIYAAIAVGQGLLLFLFGLCVTLTSTSSSNAMVDRATERIMHAPIWFFDTTPMGRITNRFSKDVDVMDDTLPEALRLFMVSTSVILGIFGLILAYFHWFAVALGPCVVIFFLSSAYYRASAREIKRHESVLRGVVVARFSETLAGVTTIRTYSMQLRFSKSIQDALDNMSSANFLTFSNQRWLALRLDTVGILLIITSGVLVLVDRFSQSPAISGLVLSYALGALQVLQFVVRQWANVENAMTATERIYAYSSGESLPTEGENGKVAKSPAKSWPEQGAITFSNVYMRYRPGLPEVLCGFDLSIKAGEHVAIVGRTGAGKSSLIGALFRVCELSEGCISIDGVDISQLPLTDLRSRLSIQPQDSILFRGTVRSNLDPFHEHTDEELWLALRGAWLADTVYLDDTVEEEGSNFSHGQRQQLGLARLLVRGSKIVVCDEATSSVDLATDDKIQQTMVESFKGKTVLTVAHRIRTIIYYDRVCVMERGQIAELGTPRELWDLGGIFRGMCETSGISEKDLERI